MTSYKYGLIAGILFFISICAAWAASSGQPAQSDPLEAALRSAGAHGEQLSMDGWAELSAPPGANTDLEGMAGAAIRGLGVEEGKYRVTSHQTRYQKIVRAEAIEDHFHAVAIAEVIYGANQSDQGKVYLVLTVETQPVREGEAALWRGRIAELMRNFGGNPRISSCLVGWLDGKLGEEEQTMRLKSGFNAVNATMTDTGNYGNFISYTGYTPLIADKIKVAGKKINFNMAMRYSLSENRTYVTVGSPVITREY